MLRKVARILKLYSLIRNPSTLRLCFWLDFLYNLLNTILHKFNRLEFLKNAKGNINKSV